MYIIICFLTMFTARDPNAIHISEVLSVLILFFCAIGGLIFGKAGVNSISIRN